MKPYYEQSGMTIYHGDCRHILADLEGVDTIITDPPWQTSNRGVVHTVTGGVTARKQESRGVSYGDLGQFSGDTLSVALSRAAMDSFIVCGYKELADVLTVATPLRGVFGWHKPNGCPTAFYPARMDLAFIVWTGKQSSLYGYQHWKSMVFSVPMPQAGCMADERLVTASGKSIHPAQGPEALYTSLIFPLPQATTILDPYMGTGTTLVAAKRLGRQAIGIEIDEKYCEIAAKRLAQEAFSFAEAVSLAPPGPPEEA